MNLSSEVVFLVDGIVVQNSNTFSVTIFTQLFVILNRGLKSYYSSNIKLSYIFFLKKKLTLTKLKITRGITWLPFLEIHW